MQLLVGSKASLLPVNISIQVANNTAQYPSYCTKLVVLFPIFPCLHEKPGTMCIYKDFFLMVLWKDLPSDSTDSRNVIRIDIQIQTVQLLLQRQAADLIDFLK